MLMVNLYPQLFEEIISENISEQSLVSPDDRLIETLISYSKSTEIVTIGGRQVLISLN